MPVPVPVGRVSNRSSQYFCRYVNRMLLLVDRGTLTMLCAGGAVVAAILLLRRSNRSRSLPHSTATEFERRVRSAHGRSRAPCILDAEPHLVHHFAIGAFSLVQHDLQRVLDPSSACAAIEALVASGLRSTFVVRRELVHFKKACLRLLQEVLLVERGLVRHTQYFYRDTRRCAEADCRRDCAQCRKWRASRQRELELCRRDPTAALPADLLPSECEERLTDDYLLVCEQLHGLRGLRIALQDTRLLLKTLCLLPRYVRDQDDIPPLLRDMMSGFTGTAEHALADVARARSTGTVEATAVPGEPAASLHVDAYSLPIALSADVMHGALDVHLRALPASLPAHEVRYICKSLFARGTPKATAQAEGGRLLARALRAVQLRSEHALAQVTTGLEELRRGLQETTATATATPTAATAATAGRVGDDNDALAGVLRFEMKLGRHMRMLRARHTANQALLTTLDQVLKQGLNSTKAGSDELGAGESSTATDLTVVSAQADSSALADESDEPQTAGATGATRRGEQGGHATPGEEACQFVAGDAARGEQSLWYPPAFAPLVAQLRVYKVAHDRSEARMRACMEREGRWPPPDSAGRTRVNEGGPLPCRVCKHSYSRLWQEKGVCWQCEQRLRSEGVCPFGAAGGSGSKRKGREVGVVAGSEAGMAAGSEAGMAIGRAELGAAARKTSDVAAGSTPRERAAAGLTAAHPFCPHQSRCAACDGGFVSCGECRLAQGDGEAVLAAIDTWRPSKLFLDFDLTLCSTRGGANPLSGARNVHTHIYGSYTCTHTHTRTRTRTPTRACTHIHTLA